MPPVKLTIPGEYWDSYIYAGRLYLFERGGSLRTVDWDRLIRETGVPEHLRLAMMCAFVRSDYLYRPATQEIMHDSEVRAVIKAKLEELALRELDISLGALERHTIGVQDNPFPYPHSDVEIYSAQMYVGTSTGVYRSTCHKKSGYPVSSRPAREWDVPAFGLAANYGSMAIAGGSEGLFELDLGLGYDTGMPEDKPLSTRPCRDCGWTFVSIFASSDHAGYWARFSKGREDAYESDAPRSFQRVETARQVFGGDGYSWGIQEKLYQVRDGAIVVLRYTPWAASEAERVKRLGTIRFQSWKGDVVSGGAATFGAVVELDKALVIIPSRGEPVTLRCEPVNWRVLPRSRHYENHLHVVREDHLEIHSFNQDYEVDQEAKLAGTAFWDSGRGKAAPLW
ncbi:MAG: hypothetical protein CVT60_04950 [Actinobacteria bacterium HGW-Actinobacteria-10]|jgi:hypothetical protein|nr:MAG: hypothetical protein CVT60_04950 [Actinobacteria bacterium HGW-Actinobacteria-10]